MFQKTFVLYSMILKIRLLFFYFKFKSTQHFFYPSSFHPVFRLYTTPISSLSPLVPFLVSLPSSHLQSLPSSHLWSPLITLLSLPPHYISCIYPLIPSLVSLPSSHLLSLPSHPVSCLSFSHPISCVSPLITSLVSLLSSCLLSLSLSSHLFSFSPHPVCCLSTLNPPLVSLPTHPISYLSHLIPFFSKTLPTPQIFRARP